MSGFVIEADLTRPAARPRPTAVEPAPAPRKWWHLLWPQLSLAQDAAIQRELGPWKPILCPLDFFRAGDYWTPFRAMCPLFFVSFVQFTMLSTPPDVAMVARVVENAMCQDCRAVAAVKPARDLTVVRAEPISTVLITLPLLGTVAIPGVVVSSF